MTNRGLHPARVGPRRDFIRVPASLPSCSVSLRHANRKRLDRRGLQARGPVVRARAASRPEAGHRVQQLARHPARQAEGLVSHPQGLRARRRPRGQRTPRRPAAMRRQVVALLRAMADSTVCPRPSRSWPLSIKAFSRPRRRRQPRERRPTPLFSVTATWGWPSSDRSTR